MTTATTRLDPIAYYVVGLGGLCLITLALIIGFLAAGRNPSVTVVEPEPADEGPAHHASNEMAADHRHHGRHDADRPSETILWGDRRQAYNERAHHLDEATGPIDVRSIAGEWKLTGEEVVPPMGQDPRIAEPIAPKVDDLFTTDWFSPERMAVR